MTTDVDNQQQGNGVPAVQPQQQPTPTPIVEERIVYKDTPNYTGNSTLETSINIFTSSAGIQADRFGNALAKAVEYNDAGLINYDALTAGLKPEQAQQARALADAAFKEQSAAFQNHVTTQTNEVYKLAGSEESWKEAAQAFNQNAPAHIKSIVNQMLQGGDMVNAAKFVLEQVQGSGLVNYGTPPMQGGAGSGNEAQGGLSKRAYFDELNKLNRKAGNGSWDAKTSIGQELIALQKRRQLGAKQGL